MAADMDALEKEPALAEDAPVCCCLKAATGGGGVLVELRGPDGPKTSSNDLSEEKVLAGGDANTPMMSVLADRLKKGLFPLAVDRAGLATWADVDTGEPDSA